MRISDWSSYVCSSDLSTVDSGIAKHDHVGNPITVSSKQPNRSKRKPHRITVVAWQYGVTTHVATSHATITAPPAVAPPQHLMSDDPQRPPPARQSRPEARRVGNECVRTCRVRG